MDPQAQAAWVIAVLAGVLSFLSPCVLPLIPGYLSMISGVSVEDLEGDQRKKQLGRVFISCLLFSLGLCAAFIPLGLAAGVIGKWLGPHLRLLNIVLGALVILFGLFLMNVVKLPFLYQDRRFLLRRRITGLWAAPVLGIAFGIGWSPCLGPWVAQLATIAANQTPLQAGILFGIYGASLGVCFIAAGLLFHTALRAFSFFQRHYRAVELTSGALLVLMGALMVTGKWNWVAGKLITLFEGG
jgi:cytochrome c-type biogenesis protein